MSNPIREREIPWTMRYDQQQAIEALAEGLFTRRQLQGLVDYRYQVPWLSQLDSDRADDLSGYLHDLRRELERAQATQKARAADRQLLRKERAQHTQEIRDRVTHELSQQRG
jgi:hypothetical protein